MVQFLELTVVAAHPSGGEVDTALGLSLEPAYRSERTAVTDRWYDQFVLHGAVGKTIDAVRKMFPYPRGDIIAPFDNDVGTQRRDEFPVSTGGIRDDC